MSLVNAFSYAKASPEMSNLLDACSRQTLNEGETKFLADMRVRRYPPTEKQLAGALEDRGRVAELRDYCGGGAKQPADILARWLPENLNGNEWRGTLSIPGFPQVKTPADFRANPAAQQAVQQASNADLDATIAQTPGANKFDPAGLRAVAHLGGTDAMQRFAQLGGQFNPADSNGTSLQAYHRKLAGTSTVAPSPTSGGAPAQTPAGQSSASSGQTAAAAPFVVGDSLGVGSASRRPIVCRAAPRRGSIPPPCWAASTAA